MNLPLLDTGTDQRVFDNKLVIKTVYQKHSLFRKASPILARNAKYLNTVKNYIGGNFKISLTDKANRSQALNTTTIKKKELNTSPSGKLNRSFDTSLPTKYFPLHNTSLETKVVEKHVRLPSISKFKRVQSLQVSNKVTSECLSIKTAPYTCKNEPKDAGSISEPQISQSLELSKGLKLRLEQTTDKRVDQYSIERVASLKTSTPFHMILDQINESAQSFMYMKKFDRIRQGVNSLEPNLVLNEE